MIGLALVAAALAIPREQVLDNAARYAAHVWRSSTSNQYAECYDGDYTSDYPPGEYTGLPYDWGGYVTLDEFDSQIADGYGAGSHSWHGILSCTTGVDCSGYVSMVWETSHYSTSTFDNGPTHEIGWADLSRGDAVNDAGSHVVLFAHESDAGWPVYYEASGSAEKVRLNTSGGWGYLDGYQPIRFDDIEDAGATGTRGAPRDITSFPFSDFRWTAGAASDVIDVYACAPDTDESGPEVLYRFEAETSGTLSLVVSDDDGVDVDIHVLTAPEGDACIARNDTTLSVEVGPGTVWIAVDTWVGSREYPGAYILTADFDGRLGELDDPTPYDTGSDDPAGDDTGSVDSAADAPGTDDTGTGKPPRARRLGTRDEAPAGCATSPVTGSLLGGLFAVGALLGRRRAPSLTGRGPTDGT
jgi:hypothetical protein